MTDIVDRTRHAESQRAAAMKIAAILLVSLMVLLLAGCRASHPTAVRIGSPDPSSQYSPLADPSGYADDYGGYTDDYGTNGDDVGEYPDNPSAYPDDQSSGYTTDPGTDTDPCAYPGDPLCPDTPITVPPPQLNPPW